MAKPARNQRCECGSGRKAKKCCVPAARPPSKKADSGADRERCQARHSSGRCILGKGHTHEVHPGLDGWHKTRKALWDGDDELLTSDYNRATNAAIKRGVMTKVVIGEMFGRG